MFFVVKRGNDGGSLRTYIHFCHVERSRDISVFKSRDSSTPLRFARNNNACKHTLAAARVLPPHDWMKIGCVIRTADQWTGSDVEKTFSTRDVAVVIELLGRDVFNDGQMFRTRTQILTHGQDFAADLAQIVHRLK